MWKWTYEKSSVSVPSLGLTMGKRKGEVIHGQQPGGQYGRCSAGRYNPLRR